MIKQGHKLPFFLFCWLNWFHQMFFYYLIFYLLSLPVCIFLFSSFKSTLLNQSSFWSALLMSSSEIGHGKKSLIMKDVFANMDENQSTMPLQMQKAIICKAKCVVTEILVAGHLQFVLGLSYVSEVQHKKEKVHEHHSEI